MFVMHAQSTGCKTVIDELLVICRNQKAQKVVKKENLNKEQNIYIRNILNNKLA